MTKTSEKQILQQFPHNVRKNIGMYLGSTEEPSVAWREVWDNCVDTIRQYGTTKVESWISDEFFIVRDDGPGLPLYTDTQMKGERIPAGQAIFQRLHYGNKSSGDGVATGGLHGVGVAAVNATSESLSAIVNLRKRVERDGTKLDKAFDPEHDIALIEFKQGVLSRCTSMTMADFKTLYNMELPADFGTVVICKPDPECWRSTKPIIDPMTPSLNKSSLITSGFNTQQLFIDNVEIQPFQMSQGFPKTKMRDDFLYEFSGVIEHDTLAPLEFTIQCAFALDAWDNAGTGSANGMPATQGPHVTSAINGVSRGLSEMSNVLNATDCKASLRVFTQIVAANRFRFDGQTKARLADIEDLSSKALSNAIATAFTESLKGKPKVRDWFNTLLKYMLEYKKASGNVELTDALKDEVPTSKDGTLGGEGSKFYEANLQSHPDSELMIVEGDSALSNILKVRNKATNAGYHALLPLRGKIINTAKSDFEKAFANKEIKTLFKVMGAGIRDVNFDLSALRYGKIIIMTDSDPDGAAICALLLAAFAKYAPEIIRAGRLYVLVTPLYGQDKKYIFNEEDLDKDRKFARYKGLGSLEPEHILDVIFGNERKLIRVLEDDMKACIELVAKPAPKKLLMQEAGLIK